MWFAVVAGGVLAGILASAAVLDWRTRRSGRRPRSPRETNAMIRDARRETWRARFRGTRFEVMFPDVKEGPDVYGTRSRSSEPPYGVPPGVYKVPSSPARRRRGR